MQESYTVKGYVVAGETNGHIRNSACLKRAQQFLKPFLYI